MRSSSLFLLLPGLLAAGCTSDDKSALASRSAALIADDLTLDPAVSEAQPVIVSLALAPSERPTEGDAGGTERVQAIAAAQDALLGKQIAGFTLGRRYRHVAAIAGRATPQAIARLGSEPGVSFVQRDQAGGGQLKEAVPAIGGDQVRTRFGLTGRGVRVAVLDTGIDTDHPDLKSSLVAQHCFTQFACPPLGNEGTSAEDDHGHGSNVAGIIASDGVVSPPGFAPDAELIAVKINDANDSGQESDWIAGMDWLYDNLATNKVKLVNLSIGTTQLHTGGAAECDRAHPAMAAAIKNLVDAGVTVFAATGNRGSSTSMGAPACNTGVIAVGAVYDSNVGRQPPANVGASYSARWGAAFAACSDATSAFDQIACFTNSNARMDLLAPGAPILSDSLRGRTELYWGTSQAAPAAVGVAALMLQCNPSLTPAQLKQALVSTGVPRMDTRNGLTFPSLRALAAVQAICDEDEIPGGDAGAPGSTPDAGRADAAVLDGAAPIASEAGVVRDGGSGNGSTPVDAAGATNVPGVGVDASGQPVVGADAAIPPVVAAAQAKADCDCSVAGFPRRGGARPVLSLGLLVALSWILRRRTRRTPSAG
jgi:subtilisin family serine protease